MFELTNRSKFIAAVVLILVVVGALLYHAESRRREAQDQIDAEVKRIVQEQKGRSFMEARAKANLQKAEFEEFQREEAVREGQRQRKASETAELEATKRATLLQERGEKLRRRAEDVNRAVVSFTLIADIVQTIRPFAFVGTRPQENATEIFRYINNACKKILSAQSAPCIDVLRTDAQNYCLAVAQVSRESIVNAGFFSDNDARFQLHTRIVDQGFRYDAAFNSCKSFLEKERAAILQEGDELSKLTNAGR